MFRTSVEIAATLEDVWAVMVDVERWPEWTPSVTDIRLLDGDQLALGGRVRIKQPRLPPTVWEVIELEPRSRFAWRSTAPGMTTIGEHQASPAGPGHVIVTLGIQRSGPLAGLGDRILERLTREYVGMEAEGLKRRCETGA